MRSIIVVVLFAHILFAETLKIAGVVTDASTHQPLVGANVTVQKTNLGAASDYAGNFTIENMPIGAYSLRVSYIGYEPKIIPVQLHGHSQFLNVQLVESFFQTDQIVVTATRTQKTMEDVPVITQIINEAEIRATGAQNLADILEDHPGLVLEKDLAGGENIRLCGIDGRFVLILVDGVPLAGKFNNRQQLDLINANQIDHVEIVKGPGSALYGSEAMGGVINVITKNPDNNLDIESILKNGSFGLYDGYVGVSGTSGKLGYSASGEYATGGIDPDLTAISVEDVTSIFFNGKLNYADSTLGRISTGLSYNVDEQLGGNVIYRTDTDVNRADAFVTWNKSLTPSLVFDTKLYTSSNSRIYSEFVRTSGRTFKVDSTQENISGVKSNFSLQLCPYSRLDMGYDYSYDNYESARVINKKVERIQHGIFINSETNYKKFTVSAGGRLDKFSEIGDYFSPRASVMYTWNPQLKLRTAIGSGFRAPSFTDMYLDFDNPSVGYRVEGNPDLQPETSIGSNIGIEYFWDYKMLLNATLFHNKFSDLIIDYSTSPGVLSYKNIATASFTTLELDTKFLITDKWTAHVNYNYTRIGDAQARKEISTVSPHSVSLDFGYKMNYWKYSIRNRWFSDRQVRSYDAQTGHYEDETYTKKAYNLLELTATWNVYRYLANWRADTIPTNDLFNLRFGIQNLLDYTDLDYGPWFGRRYFIDIEVQL